MSPRSGAMKKFSMKIIALVIAILFFPLTLLHGYTGDRLGVSGDEAELWGEIADIRFQAAQGHDLQSNIRKDSAFRARAAYDTTTPGDELDLAGDEKYLASEDYRSATKHWEKAAKGFSKVFAESGDARSAKENAAAAWEAAKRSLREAIHIHRMAHEYYEKTNNLEKKTVVLGKIARNLERLIEMKSKNLFPTAWN